VQEIGDWLEKLGMSEYGECFAQNKIDLSVLPHLTDQDLKDIGVPLGHRRKMLAAVAQLDDTSIAEALRPIADEKAVAWYRRSIESNGNYSLSHFHLAAALAHLGRLDEARAEVQAGIALDPKFALRRYRAGTASDNPTYLAQRERIYEGMRKAGVPEQ
jgi:tetratricopeptide (TPR) repeat protein